MIDGKKTGTFIALDGRKYTITGFTRMMMLRVEESVKTAWELEEHRPLPQRPTYKAEDAFGGEEIIYYHTKDTLETDEEKAAWAKYEQEQDELETRVWQHMMYEALNCVIVPLEDLKQYVHRQKIDTGLLLPDPEKYETRVKRLYVEHVVLCDNTDEMMRLLAETMKVAGVISGEEVKQAMKSFRDQKTEQDSEPAQRPDSAEQAGDS